MEILDLNEVLLKELLDQIIELEKIVYTYSGSLYTDVPWTKENFKYLLPRKNEFSFAAVDNHKILGFTIGYEYKPEWGHISKVAIHPELQGRGLGKLLVVKQTNAMFEQNIKFITIETRKANYRAFRLYEGAGYNILEDELLKAYIKIRERHQDVYIGDSRRQIVLEKHIINFDIGNYFEKILMH